MREGSFLTFVCVTALGAAIVFGFYIMEAVRNMAGAPIP